MPIDDTYSAFAGWKQIASGSLPDLLRKVKFFLESAGGGKETLLIFHDQTGREVDFDFRGSLEQVLDRADPGRPQAGPGRPKLGVTSREISLLPRHWEWLEAQPSGASATLRRLVEEARKRNPMEAETRAAIEASGRFMSAMAGNLPGFEEAYRALYARDRARLEELAKDWPADVRDYAIARLPLELAVK